MNEVENQLIFVYQDIVVDLRVFINSLSVTSIDPWIKFMILRQKSGCLRRIP